MATASPVRYLSTGHMPEPATLDTKVLVQPDKAWTSTGVFFFSWICYFLHSAPCHTACHTALAHMSRILCSKMQLIQKRIELRTDWQNKDVQKPYSIVTCNGEVHTHQEVQVFVHDLNQFVTVQTTRRNACCPIAGQALQRPRILL